VNAKGLGVNEGGKASTLEEVRQKVAALRRRAR